MNFFRIRRKQQHLQHFFLLFILLGCTTIFDVSVLAFVVQPIVPPTSTSSCSGGSSSSSSSGSGSKRQIQISPPSTTTRLDALSSSRLFHCSHPPSLQLNLHQHQHQNENHHERITTPIRARNANTNALFRRKETSSVLSSSSLSSLNGSLSPDNNNMDGNGGENNLKSFLYSLYKLTFARLWNTWFFRLLRRIKARVFHGPTDENDGTDVGGFVKPKKGNTQQENGTKQIQPLMNGDNTTSNKNSKELIAEKYVQEVMDRVQKQQNDVATSTSTVTATATAVTKSVVAAVAKTDSAIQEVKEVAVVEEEMKEEEDAVGPIPETNGEKMEEVINADAAPTMELSEVTSTKVETELRAEEAAPVVTAIEQETTAGTTTVQDKVVEEQDKVEEEEVVSEPKTTVEAEESILKPVIDDIAQIEKDIAIVEQSFRSSIETKKTNDEEDALSALTSQTSQELSMPLPHGNRWAIAAPDIDLSATWKIVVNEQFKKDYDQYLKNLGQPAIVRSIAVSIIELTTEEIVQTDKGRSLCIKGKNLRGVWERTLLASGSDHENDFDEENQEHEYVDLITADNEKVKAEAWWDNNGTVHRSYLRGGKKYGGGDFESKRYLEDDGKTLICESVFHPKEGKEPAVIKWTFARAG